MQPTPRDALPYRDTRRGRGHRAASHGAVTFFVRGKRTLCHLTDDHHGDGRLALVCPAPPGVQEDLVGSDSERFSRPP